MSETRTVDEGWDESLDSDQVTHVKSDPAVAAAVSGEWLVNVEDQAVIPMSTQDVVEALRTRRINDRALVWRVGMQDWTALADVPALRLAAGKLQPPVAPPPPIAAPVSARPSSLPPASSERSLRPPPKESARAARDERQRKNTLPFGFPAVKSAAPRPAPSASPAKREDSVSGALAVYERAPASLTFADSVRAEWNGTNKLTHQQIAAKPDATHKSPVRAGSVPPSSRPLTPRKPILVAPLEPKDEATRRIVPEPALEAKPRLALEPQSDPVQSARPEPRLMPKSLLQSNTLAPTTSEADYDQTVRQPMWGDLSVVLASDLREAQKSSKRIVVAASLGSAVFASLLTLWIAHSSLHANASVAAAQPVAVETAKPVATFIEAARPAPVEPAPAPVPASEPPVAKPAATHAAAVSAAPIARARAVATPRLRARRVAPAVQQASTPEVDSQSPQADANPYADPAPTKAATTSVKDSSESSGSSDSAKAEPAKPATPKPSTMPSDGLSDGEGSGAHTAPAAAPGF